MKRFKKILAVFSDELPGDAALGWLDGLAKGAEAEGIDLLICSPTLLEEYPGVERHATGGEDFWAPLKSSCERILSAHRTKWLQADGDPMHVTLRHLASGEYDLVVVPVAGAETRMVSERLARKSPVGVLVLPHHSTFPPRRIMASLDFSDLSGLVIDWSEAFASLDPQGAKLEAVHVLDLSVRTRATIIRDAEELRDDIRQTADWQLQSYLEDHAGAANRWSHRLIEGQVPTRDLATVLESDADLLVIGCHGRSALSVALMGSNAAETVRHAQRPVLFVRQKNQNLGFLRELIGWDR
jgi:nucleotide-binding universal stress UspA family protein